MATTHTDWHQFLLLLLLSQLFSASAVTTVYKEECKSLDDSPTDLKAAITNTTGIELAADLSTKPLECGSFLHILQTVCELSTKDEISSKMFVLSCNMGRQLQALFDKLNIKYEKQEFFSNCLEMDYQKATVRSDIKATVQFMHSMLDKLNGNKMIVITDLQSDFIRKELASHYLSAVIVNATDIDTSFTEKINKLKYHGAHFFVLCTPKTTREILKTVDKKVLFSPQSWIILTDMPHEILMDKMDIPYNTRVAVATTSKSNTKIVPPNAALLWTTQDKQSPSCANLNKASVPNTKLDKPVTGKIDLTLELYEVYSVSKGRPLNYVNFASWFSPNNRMATKGPFPNRLRKLDGIELRVVTIESPPYIILKPNGSMIQLDGFFGLLFNDLAAEMNFTFQLRIAKEYGIKEKGQWNGLFKVLKDDEADIGVCDLSVTVDRNKIVDFSSTISSGNLRLVYKIPDEKFHFRLYIVPFGWEIWLLVLASIILSGVLLYITNRVSPKSALQSTTDPTQLAKIKHQFSILDCVFAVYNGFNQQGTDLEPREVSGKIIFITVYLSFVIIFASYTSVFTSFLTISDNKKLFETLEEAYADKSYEFGVVKNTNYETVFRDENDESSIQYKVWKRIDKDKNNLVPNINSGLDRAFTRKFALLVPKESTSYFLRNNCSFDTSSENIFTDFYHFAYKKGFPYAEAFNEYINRLVEGGVTARLDSKYQRDKINFCESDGVKPLGFKKVVSLYLLLAGASLFAAAALSIEWLFRIGEDVSRKQRQPRHSFLVKTIQQSSKPIMNAPTTSSSFKTYYYS